MNARIKTPLVLGLKYSNKHPRVSLTVSFIYAPAEMHKGFKTMHGKSVCSRIRKLEINKPHEMETTKTITCIVSNGARGVLYQFAHTLTHMCIVTLFIMLTMNRSMHQPAYSMTKAILYGKMVYKSRESN